MVDGVLGQVLNYRSRQRGLDLEEERMRQNQEYRQAQLGQYERGLDLKRVNLISSWKRCSMNTTEVSQLLQITLKILKMLWEDIKKLIS